MDYASDISSQCLASKKEMISDPQSRVYHWLLASCLYYHHAVSLFSDYEFDRLSRDMYDDWPTLNHEYLDLITQEDLETGSGFAINYEDYPEEICRHADAVA